MSQNNASSIAVLACSVLENEIKLLARGARHIVETRFFELGMHDRPEQMRIVLQEHVDQLDARGDIEAIVLAYGLCGLGTVGLHASRHALVLPRAHDCITLFMGSKEAYARHRKQCADCYYYTPGWNRKRRVPGPERLAWLRSEYAAKFDAEEIDDLIEAEREQWRAYQAAVFLDLGTDDAETECAYARRCAQWLGWRFERMQGDPKLLRDLIWGNWDEGRFQIVQPGMRLAHATDESIMRAEPVATINIDVELESNGSRRIAVERDNRSLAEILAANGIAINTRCGGRGLCRGCELELRAGSVTRYGEIVSAPATVQACLSKLNGAASIYIPARAQLAKAERFEAFDVGVAHAVRPLFPVAGKHTAFAIDVGTTTVDLVLVDLASGEVLSRTGEFNRQLRFGDNVLARIDAARDPARLAEMNRAVVEETIRPLLARACGIAGRPMGSIAGGTIAGNTTMLHLLVGEDPTPLGVAPFTPTFISGKRLRAADINMSFDGLAPETPIQLLPGIAAYIGADIMAGVAASGMALDSAPSLLVDIGTNGEIALQAGGKLIACATAAGPAFEGCGLSCGMPAQTGAVSEIRFGLEPFVLEAGTIGGVAPDRAAGLCGSAYVDFLALGRSCGLLTETGRFDRGKWHGISVENRIENKNGRAVRFGNLSIHERDIALLQQAKAAIGAGIEILLEKAGVRVSDLGRVYLAGAFGMHLNVAHAIAIGLLPRVREEQVRVIGNSALAGAYLALMDREVLEKMESMRAEWEVIQLNSVGSFEERFIEHLMLGS
ncbi:ASKHA domain-containing protein [bacterium]|nr:ASKHA domain-containing protein [bacterium]